MDPPIHYRCSVHVSFSHITFIISLTQLISIATIFITIHWSNDYANRYVLPVIMLCLSILLFSTLILFCTSYFITRSVKLLNQLASRITAFHRLPASTQTDLPSKGHTKEFTFKPANEPLNVVKELVTVHSSHFIYCCSLQLIHEFSNLEQALNVIVIQLKSNYESLDHMTKSRQHLIRYLFHELRVPLNAVILGINELRVVAGTIDQSEDVTAILVSPSSTSDNKIHDRDPFSLTGSTYPNNLNIPTTATIPDSSWNEQQRGILSTISNQSKVIARVLNDLLSLTKIEDHQFQLHYNSFNRPDPIIIPDRQHGHSNHNRVVSDPCHISQLAIMIHSPSAANNFRVHSNQSRVGISTEIIDRKWRLPPNVPEQQLIASELSDSSMITLPSIASVTMPPRRISALLDNNLMRLSRQGSSANEEENYYQDLEFKISPGNGVGCNNNSGNLKNQQSILNKSTEKLLHDEQQHVLFFPTAHPTPIDSIQQLTTVDSRRILVVEDSIPSLNLLLMILKRLQYEAIGVGNGQLAVAEFKEYARKLADHTILTTITCPYDLILMDGNMPIKTGKEATAELRAMGINIPIIAVTGNALPEDIDEFMSSGANALITKPINAKELKKILKQYLP